MEPAGGVLSRVLRDLGLERDVLGWKAVEEWPRLVGARVARHARAVAFREGALHVEVEGSAWMHELGFLKRELIRRINQQLEDGVVREIRFVLPQGGARR